MPNAGHLWRDLSRLVRYGISVSQHWRARHKGVSQAQILADLIARMDQQMTAKMDDAAFAEYVTG